MIGPATSDNVPIIVGAITAVVLVVMVVVVIITVVVCGVRNTYYRKRCKVAVRGGMYCTVVIVTV